jgi:DNA-binding Xre family transcriptional regulator
VLLAQMISLNSFNIFGNSLGGCPSELTNMPVINVEILKLGLRIKALRKVLGMNKKSFSKKCGLDGSYFAGIERGERNLTFSNLCQICAGLNCDIAAVTKGIPHPRTATK